MVSTRDPAAIWPRLWPPLVAVGIVGILCNYPTVFYHLHPSLQGVAVWFLTNLVGLSLLVGLGLWLAPRVGLASRVVEVSAQGVLLGIAVGLAATAWFLLVATALGHLDFISGELAEPTWVAVLGGAGAAVNEELGERLGILTALIWLGARLLSRSPSSLAVVGSAIALSAALFGLSHVGTAGVAVAGTAGGLATVLLATGGSGALFAWLFWRHGLLSAIVAHALLDCFGSAVAPFVLPVLQR
jgi:hypothetical protein